MDADATKKDKGDYIIGAPPFRNRDQVQMLFNFLVLSIIIVGCPLHCQVSLDRGGDRGMHWITDFSQAYLNYCQLSRLSLRCKGSQQKKSNFYGT